MIFAIIHQHREKHKRHINMRNEETTNAGASRRDQPTNQPTNLLLPLMRRVGAISQTQRSR